MLPGKRGPWQVSECGSNHLMSDTVYDCPDYPLLLILSGPSGVGKDTVRG